MRVVLLYPPPRQIDLLPQPQDGAAQPAEKKINKSDECLAPYGLLSIAAQAIEAGHQVKTLNVSTFPWDQIEDVIRRLEADVYGVSCFTSHRSGAAAMVECIRRRHPRAHIVVGGPHVSPLPTQTLQHWPAVDTVVIGEGERTFLELLDRLGAGQSVERLAGAAWRDAGGTRIGPPHERIEDLDTLTPVQKHFPYSLLLTSRGCPGQCTFCASSTMWGRRVSFHRAGYVLDTIQQMLQWMPAPTIMIKDDTFTVNRRRTMEICQGILDRKLNFLWSCDTRADVLDEELLRTMRLAGCQQISLGVESASPTILETIRKKVTPAQVIEATRLAKKFGLRVRYFMMAGNRGETFQTYRESIDFIRAAEPHEYVFSILSIYPGTEEYEIFKSQGHLTDETFFEKNDSPVLWLPPGEKVMRDLVEHHFGRNSRTDSLEAHQAVLRELPNHHAAHLDVGAACFRAGQIEQAELHLRRALELGFPVPELALNYLAGITGRRGDHASMRAQLAKAADRDNPHPILAGNLRAVKNWLDYGGRERGLKLNLVMRHDFECILTDSQPVVAGELPDDLFQWSAPQAAAPIGVA